MQHSKDDAHQAQPSEPLSSKIHALSQIKKQFRHLKNQLHDLGAKRDGLEQEIFVIRAATAPIKRVPAEILSEIFINVTTVNLWDGDRPYIGEDMVIEDSIFHLMVVCKTWRVVVINTPQVWRTICLEAPHGEDEEDPFRWSQRQIPYIDHHLERSKAVLLDIIIDFSYARTGTEVGESRIVKGFDDFRGDEKHAEFMSKWNCKGLEEMKAKHEVSYENLIWLLIGKDDSHMARWRSLSLSLPENEILGERLWNHFNHAAPKLEEFTLEIDIHGHNFESPGSSWIVWPSVKRMALKYSATLDLVHPFPKLQELEMASIRSWEGFERLYKLSDLKKLSLSVDIDIDPPVVTGPIRLPKLTDLRMDAWLPPEVIKAFQLDSLAMLTLEDTWAARATIPNADAFTVAQHVVYLSLRTKKGKEYKAGITKFLNRLFPQLSSAHTIEVVPEVVDIATIVADALKEKGCLQSLRKIIPLQPCNYSFF